MKNQARMCTAAMVGRAPQSRPHGLKAPVSAMKLSAPAKAATRHDFMRWRRHPIAF